MNTQETSVKRENSVIIDWLSVTSKIHSPEDIMMMVGMPERERWQQMYGVRGYQTRFVRDSITIHWGGAEGNGVWLEMSGQGCRAFETYGTGDYNAIFRTVLDNPDEMNITRVDIAFDEYTGIVDIDRVCDDTAKQKYKAKATFWEVIQSAYGKSCQVGSPTSLVLIRIYDKLAERLSKVKDPAEREKIQEEIPHWTRVELQLRDERAREFVKYLYNADPVTEIEKELTLGEAYSSVLSSYLIYGYETAARGHPEQKVWHTFPYWQEVLKGASALSIYRTPGVDYNLQRCTNYIQNMAGNAVDALMQIYGTEGFVKLIQGRQIKQNPKYAAMIERNGIFGEEARKEEEAKKARTAELLRRRQELIIERLATRMRSSSVPFIVDGVRYILCEHCNKVKPTKDFSIYGGQGHENLGTCKECF